MWTDPMAPLAISSSSMLRPIDNRRAASGIVSIGRVTPAPWEPDLASAMREHGIAVFEETVWETLREDLLPHAATER